MIIREHVPLAPYTTFRIGGAARYFAEAENENDVTEALLLAEKEQLSVFILGAGSNVLVADDGFDGVVLHMVSNQWYFTDDGVHVIAVADAGTGWDAFVHETVVRGLWGVENLSGIPSSVGATPVQNIGAYGVEAKDTIVWVEAYDRNTRAVRRLSNFDCSFGYRDSIFKHNEGAALIVLRVAYRLSKNGIPNIAYKDLEAYHNLVSPLRSVDRVREAVLSIREKKFPKNNEAGTAGSFFKNPIVSREEAAIFLERFPGTPLYPQSNGTQKLSAAWIIDHVLGMKGARTGDVGTWNTQALIIVNYGGARADDVTRFVSEIIRECENKIQLTLEPEVITVGKIFFQK